MTAANPLTKQANIQRVVYLHAESGEYVRSGGTSTRDLGQAEVYFAGSKRYHERWKRYGYVEVPVSVLEIIPGYDPNKLDFNGIKL